jgi:hypothetical protein
MAWRLGSVVMAAVAASMLVGCSVHLPKTAQVALDYSDHDFYDRSFAASSSASRVAQYEPHWSSKEPAPAEPEAEDINFVEGSIAGLGETK